MAMMQKLVGVARELELAPTESIRRIIWHEARKRATSSRWHYVGTSLFYVALGFGIVPTIQWIGRSVAAWGPATPGLIKALIAVSVGLGWGCTVSWLMRRSYRRAVRSVLNERGYPVCMACGYSLTGLDSPRCPECGRAFR